MNTETTLSITQIQRFCMHDGPGIRTTVFFKGCPLRCTWCHNPETQKSASELLFYHKKCIGCGACAAVCPRKAHTLAPMRQIDRTVCKTCFACAQACPTGALEACGKRMTLAQILDVAEKDRAFYGESGGVTLSGGEPFAQGDATVALLRACKERGLSTAVESCGFADLAVLQAAVPFTDLFLWDVKDTDEARHKQYTGVSPLPILQNLRAIDALGARTRLRCILVNGVNTDRAHYRRVAQLSLELANCEGVELMPYHAYGGAKTVCLGKEDSGRTDWILTDAQIEQAKAFLKSCGARVL